MKASHHFNCIGYALLLLFTCHVQLRIVCLQGIYAFTVDRCAASLVQSSSYLQGQQSCCVRAAKSRAIPMH